MNDKILTLTEWPILLIATAAAGFAAGRMTTPAIKTQETQKEAHHTQEQVQSIQTHLEAKKEAAEGFKTVYVKKYYCPSGNLKSEVKMQKETLAVGRSVTENATRVFDLKTNSQEMRSTSKIEYQSRWGAGVFLPAQYPLKPQDLNLMISYKLIGPFSIAAQSDVLFKIPMVGVVINF